MNLKTYYKTGVVKVEKDKDSYDFYEMKDGTHVLPHDGVYHDRQGKLPPVATFIDGLIAPVGTQQTVSMVDKVWNNMDTSKDGGASPSISSSWKRSLVEFMDKAIKYVPLILVIALIAYALISTNSIPGVSK